MSGSVINKKREGEFIFYEDTSDGVRHIQRISNYKNGKRDGAFKLYKNGVITYLDLYQNGKLIGTKRYDDYGNIVDTMVFEPEKESQTVKLCFNGHSFVTVIF
jgi:ribosomal protein S1